MKWTIRIFGPITILFLAFLIHNFEYFGSVFPDYWIDIILAILILWYVIDSFSLAKNASIQSKIATTPVITARILNKGDSGDWGRVSKDKNYAKIHILIKNHTRIHANLKVGVNYEGVIDGKKVEGIIEDGSYDGKDVWDFPAMGAMPGNFSITKFSDLTQTKNVEYLYLNISIKSKPFGLVLRYNDNPILQYHWKHSEKKWVFSPVPVVKKSS